MKTCRGQQLRLPMKRKESLTVDTGDLVGACVERFNPGNERMDVLIAVFG